MKKLIIPSLMLATFSVAAQQQPTQESKKTEVMQVIEESSSPSEIYMLSPQQKEDVRQDLERRSSKSPRPLSREQMRQAETPEPRQGRTTQENPR
jgi:hypothetical protein